MKTKQEFSRTASLLLCKLFIVIVCIHAGRLLAGGGMMPVIIHLPPNMEVAPVVAALSGEQVVVPSVGPCPLHGLTAPHACTNPFFNQAWNPAIALGQAQAQQPYLPQQAVINLWDEIKFPSAMDMEPVQVQILVPAREMPTGNLDQFVPQALQDQVILSNQLTLSEPAAEPIQLMRPVTEEDRNNPRFALDPDHWTVNEALVPEDQAVVYDILGRPHLYPKVTPEVPAAVVEEEVVQEIEEMEEWVTLDEELGAGAESADASEEQSKTADPAMSETLGVTAWPVPSAGQVHMQVRGCAGLDTHLQVWSPAGTLVQEAAVTEGQVMDTDLSAQASGIYVVRLLRADGKQATARLVVRH